MPNTTLRRQPQKGFRQGGAKKAYHGGSSRQQRTFTAGGGRNEGTSSDEKWERTRLAHTIDEKMGFPRYEAGRRREGWLVNVQPTSIEDNRVEGGGGRAAIDLYFIDLHPDGNAALAGTDADSTTFKATIEYEPYFLVAVRKGHETEVEEWCKRVPGGGGLVKRVRRIDKEDLQMPNHLLGYRRTFLELRFDNVQNLMAVRRDIMPIAEANKKGMKAMDTYAEVAGIGNSNSQLDADGEAGDYGYGYDLYDDDTRTAHADDQAPRTNTSIAEASDYIVDIREYDVPYHVRVLIDMDIRVAKWYYVEVKHGVTSVTINEERLAMADPVVMAFDIETTKSPLKFPDATIDQIMMISYMIDGQGFLITNREIVSEDIADFEYTPRPEYQGPFMIFNEPGEKALLERFFQHVQGARPTVIATYNGDFFDWPFVEARASANGIDMYHEIGWRRDSEDQYKCNYSVHMDCFHWVNRDSYLPQGSRGLKAVTVAKLGYDPDELDPELMLPYAQERPQTLAEYSVSDAVATYYLYMKYVHPFIFSLCTILPLSPDEVLRKGTGTLCEMLLMVQAFQKEIVLPNKHVSPKESFWEGHLLDAETYVGGHVESIEAGVFRADIPVNFAVDPAACDELLRDLDAALEFSIVVEEKKSLDDVTNYDDVKARIAERLEALKTTPNRTERPLIYHLDVASMYPNIMTTNRLQPDSMIKEEDCATCDFNRPGKTCDRRMPWAWRGEYVPAKRDEYNMIRHALENERFPGKGFNAAQKTRSFQDLSADEQAGLIRKRLQLYSQKVYHKIHDSTTIVREAIICQRENPFYINTVRDFRDRRYDYKGKAKVWKGKTEALKASGAGNSEIDSAKKMIVLFDSLQLAHKVILNSFYGYVMRKGSRWYSMEMAGVTCLTGATIIQMARELVERLGRPLELDTDGIWCMLPATFPENFSFTLKNGKKMTISYPCVMLNHLVHARFTNHQYQTLVDGKTFKYETHSDNSIFFEVDGPYKAMVLPTSKEEDKNLKKRYAVFNDDGSLAELKGFEVKRRGELKLIKIFQQQIFKFFLDGTTLAECYAAVAKVANRWLDVLHSKGATLADEELMELISENRSMSKTLEEYGTQKSTSITTARRLADFLGEGMVKDKGLNCKFIICARPRNAPVTERAVPVAIFSANETTKRMYLKKWLKEEPANTDPRALLDWDYYLERLGSVIQKLITIPAALQKIRNPVPRVAHPDWLQRRINIKDDRMKQKKLTDLFGSANAASINARSGPLEDITNSSSAINNGLVARVTANAVVAADMEDFGMLAASQKLIKPTTAAGAVTEMMTAGNEDGGVIAAQSTAAQKRKSPVEEADAAANPLDPYSALPKVMPSPSDDYVEFLAYQKKKWAIQKQARARRRHLFGERAGNGGSGGGVVPKTSNIHQSFQHRAEMTYRNTWQLLQLKTTDSPGIVSAYVLIDARIHHLKICVPRQVFLNLKSKDLPDIEIAGCEVEQVNHTLPNGHSSVYLFKLTVSEDVYFAEAEKFALLFNHPSVEGVYERQLPLNISALLKLGNRCTIDESQQGVLGKGLDQGFDLGGLIRPPKTLKPYLDPASMAYIHLTHISSGERQVFGLFSSTGAQAHIVVLHKSRESVQGMPNIGRIYADLLARRRAAEVEAKAGATPAALAALASAGEKEAAQQAAAAATTWRDCFPYQDALTVKVTQVTTRRKAFLEIGDLVKKMRKEEIGRPQIVVVQSSQRSLLVHQIPVLNEFPVLPLKNDPLDSSLPPLGWQSVAARRLVSHYLALGSWVMHMVGLARYGDVPLCNLERDDPRFLIDVAYARRLQSNNVVLWWSGSPRPDHAGYEKDDVAGALETVALPKINNPGTFASVCIDIEVRNLAINTILTSSLINELEGADAAVSFNPAADVGMGDDGDGAGLSTLYSENAFSNASILVLREMVKGWWAEACKGNAMADLVVNNLVRWVENPDSFLYDRALHYYVQMMSRKAFLQLMADFRRVGSQVIFASANRLLLQTTKAEVSNAYAYSQYILKSIKGRPLFSFIEMDIKEYWDYLVWYDEYNYGGKACLTNGSGEPVMLPEGTQSDEQPYETIMHWQLNTFLPVRLQPVFSDWVVEFIQLMHALKRPGGGNEHGSQPRLTQLPAAVLRGGDESGDRAVLGQSFERPLKKEIAGLISTRKREMLHPELAADYDYPVLPGVLVTVTPANKPSKNSAKKTSSLAASRDPLLDLVKSLMQVLSLDKNIVMEARLLRKELLALFDVREFSRDATFQNPSESLKLAQLSCDNCTMSRDLDLCRDDDLVLDPGRPWACTFCEAEYDRIALEERLVAAVEAEAVAWSVQDLKCGRCGALRVNDFMDHCTCSGVWGPTIRRDEIVRRLRVYHNVAQFYGLRMLGDVVEEVLGAL